MRISGSWGPDGVYGVDLEESDHGDISTDMGRAAAFRVSYDPAATAYKRDAVQYMIETCAKLFSIEKRDIRREMEKELAAMKARRTPGNRGRR